MKKLAYIILIINILSFSACGKKAAENKEAEAATETKTAENPLNFSVSLTDAQYKNADITFAQLETRNLGSSLKVNGKIDIPPQSMISVSTPVAGFVRKTDLLEGTHVRKGQVVAVIQNPDFIQIQQDLLESQQILNDYYSQSEYLDAEYTRQQTLAKENINAGKTLQLAKSQSLSMKAKIQGEYAKIGALKARLKLMNINPDNITPENFQSEINIYSPINGYVTQIHTNIGKFVNPTDILFNILDNSHVHAELSVFEKDIPKIKIGQKVKLRLNTDNQERSASIHLIGKEIDENKMVRVHSHLDKEDGDLIPGTYLSAFVEVGNVPVLAIPDEAIVQYENKFFVFIPSSNSQNAHEFRMIEVFKGVSENGFTEISLPSEVDVNSKIVTKGTFELFSVFKSASEGGEE
jgi:cobalt-zinc-cadmium efflux system membrane fusion protein